MGDEKMKNLQTSNILTDDGCVSPNTIAKMAEHFRIALPDPYTAFISRHNGASLKADVFDYHDTARREVTSNSIAFLGFERIECFMRGLLADAEDDEGYFPERLIPFGDNGGGDFICFDYRQDPKTDDPPVVLWSHDVADNAMRISFIANNFEEFVNMLHEPEDE